MHDLDTKLMNEQNVCSDHECSSHVKQILKECCLFKSQAVPVVSLAAPFLNDLISSTEQSRQAWRMGEDTGVGYAPSPLIQKWLQLQYPLTATHTYSICRDTVHTCKCFIKGCIMHSDTGWMDKKKSICVIKGKHEPNLRGGTWESGTC